MGHPAAACVVVEDSLPGVQAAVAAGMPVCAYAAVLAALGAEVFTEMGDLVGMLGLDRR